MQRSSCRRGPSGGEVLQTADLPPLAGNGDGGPATSGSLPEGKMDLTRVVEGVEEKLLRQALAQAAGVKAEAAKAGRFVSDWGN